MERITFIQDMGKESPYHLITIYYCQSLDAYIIDANSKKTDREDLVLIFCSRQYPNNKNAKALQAALRRAETLADISTL